MVEICMLHVTRESVGLARGLAEGQWRAGNLEEAEGICRQILEVAPEDVGTLRVLGAVCCARGEWLEGERVWREVVGSGEDAEGRFHLGVSLEGLGRMEEACGEFRRAVALKGDFAEGWNALGAGLVKLGRVDEGAAALKRALALRGEFAEAYNSMGIALRARGRLEEARECYEKALAVQPRYPEALNNLGIVLRELGREREAAACYERAMGWIEPGPVLARVLNNLANLKKGWGDYDGAVAFYERAVGMEPGYGEAWSNLGIAWFEMGRVAEALAAHRKGMELEQTAEGRARAHDNLLFCLHFWEENPRVILAEHVRWDEKWGRQLADTASPPAPPLPHHDVKHEDTKGTKGHEGRIGKRRVRVGYVSPDFRDHCQAFFMMPLLANHDRERVEVFCYSGVVKEDALTARMKGYAEHWRSTVGKTDAEIVEMVRGDEVEVLVDLAMRMGGGRPGIFARKGAPVQVAWLAYPSTTGMRAMDYRVTDFYLDPEGMGREELYVEKLLRGETFWCYDPLVADRSRVEVTPLPALEKGYVTFGCLNNFAKVNDRMLRVWGEVLRRVEGSRLVLMAPPGKRREEVLRVLAEKGVGEGGREQVEFVLPVGRETYLRRYQGIDLCLDTYPYNGHTTSLDGLWMGVPAVTLCGETAVSRAGLSQLTHLGLEELVAGTEEEFVEIAVRWAEDLERLGRVRRELRGRMERSVLMDGKRFARGMERMFWEMVRERGVRGEEAGT